MRWSGAPLLLAAAVLAAGLGVLASTRWRDAEQAAGIGVPVARFVLPNRAGRPIALPTPGRAVLINYWASWCQPCRVEMPLLDAYARRNAGNGPQVVGIAMDTRESAEAFLAQVPVSFPILFEMPDRADSSVRLGDEAGLLPYSVLVGADGRLRARRLGQFRSRADLEAWVAAAR